MAASNLITLALTSRRGEIQSKWSKQLSSSTALPARGRTTPEELDRQIHDFLDVFTPAVQSGKVDDIRTPEWAEVRSFLEELSRRRVEAGYSSDETATFIFSLKRPLFDVLP